MEKFGLKKIGTAILCAALAVMMPANLAVAENSADDDRKFELHCTYDGEPVANATFNIYYIGEIDDDDSLVMSNDFAAATISAVDVDDVDTVELSETLEGYVHRDKLEPVTSAVTDGNGVAQFEIDDVDDGVYLCDGDELLTENKIYKFEPFLVEIPQDDLVSVPKIMSLSLEEAEQLSVLKVWKDNENAAGERPESITVQLLRDDDVYQELELSSANNWRHTWYALDENYEWRVVEKEAPEDYKVSITTEGSTVVITNTNEPEVTTEETTEATTEETTEVLTEETTEATTEETTEVITEETTELTTETSTELTTEASTELTTEVTTEVEEGTPTDPEITTTEVTTENETSEPDEPDEKLPQTGTMWYLVPLFTMTGLALFVLGYVTHTKSALKEGSDENEEKQDSDDEE
jgi:hypothetical protein